MTSEIRSAYQHAGFNKANRCQNRSVLSKVRSALTWNVVRVANDLASQTHGISRTPQTITKHIWECRNCVFTEGDDVEHISLARIKVSSIDAALLTVQQPFLKVALSASFLRATSNLSAAKALGEQG
jgi:hypothetical protein